MAQKRLRNGSINGRETLEPVASASPIGHPLSWEVPLVSDKEPRRAGPARARVPETPFPPRLYDAPCARYARACTRARPRVRKSRAFYGATTFDQDLKPWGLSSTTATTDSACIFFPGLHASYSPMHPIISSRRARTSAPTRLHCGERSGPRVDGP